MLAWRKIVDNAISTVIAAVILGACGWIVLGATGVNKRIKEHHEVQEKVIATQKARGDYLEAIVKIMEEEMIIVRRQNRDLKEDYNSLKSEMTGMMRSFITVFKKENDEVYGIDFMDGMDGMDVISGISGISGFHKLNGLNGNNFLAPAEPMPKSIERIEMMIELHEPEVENVSLIEEWEIPKDNYIQAKLMDVPNMME